MHKEETSLPLWLEPEFAMVYDSLIWNSVVYAVYAQHNNKSQRASNSATT